MPRGYIRDRIVLPPNQFVIALVCRSEIRTCPCSKSISGYQMIFTDNLAGMALLLPLAIGGRSLDACEVRHLPHQLCSEAQGKVQGADYLVSIMVCTTAARLLRPCSRMVNQIEPLR